MHKRTFSAFVTLPAILLALLASGCGSGHNEGQAAPVASPTATGNVQSQILSVSTPAGGPTVVTFTLFDESGAPLNPVDVLAASGGRFRVTIGRLKADGNYESYCKSNTAGVPGFDASTPTASQFATVGTGTYTYTFKTNLDNAAQTLGGIVLTGSESRTHTVAIQIVRNSTTFTGKPFQQAANPYFNFRPDGGAVAMTREVVSISACNRCHGVLGLHGGGRREIALCILCHYPGINDPTTTNSIDMKSMVHKIHYGLKLPSNRALDNVLGPTVAVGFTIGTSSFKTVEYPMLSGDSNATRAPIKCVKCHVRGTNLAGQPYGADVDKWKAAPTANKCRTCHDTVTFNGETSVTVIDNVTPVTISTSPWVVRHDLLAGGTIDVSGAGGDNSVLCSLCHANAAFETAEFNFASVPGAHTVLEESAVNTGIHYQIVSVDNATPGNRPVVRFRITTDNGAVIAPSQSGASFNLKLGYPAADYTNNAMNAAGQPWTKSLSGATANGDGSYTATFDNTIPASATGVGVIGLEGRATYNLPGFRTGTTARIGGQSVQYYFDMATGAQVTDPSRTRRRIVDVNKCLVCHGRLSLHGANRVNSIEECVICHNSSAFWPVAGEGVFDFKVFIHKLHTGEDLDPSQKPFWGFEEVRYPQDRRNCLACHIDANPKTFGIPLTAGVRGTTINLGADNTIISDDTKTPPMQAVCTSCHGDQTFTAPHVANQTSGTVELCAQCHTTGLLLGPDFAHEAVR